MYGKVAGILLPFLVVGVVGAGVWGYQENHEKNSILIKAENQYQRAYHDLNAHMEQLQDELGKTLAVNSRFQLTPSLANVWRLSYSAQNDVGQLPLTLLPFNKTEEFLTTVANFSYKTAVRDLDKTPLTKQEYETLQGLFNKSKEVQRELQKVQTNIIDNQLRWMDVEKALAMEEKQEDNTIIDGLKMVDKNVEGFNTTEFGVGVGTPNQPDTKKTQSVLGKEISQEQAKKKATEFSGLSSGEIKKINVDRNSKAGRIEAYSIRIEKNNSKQPVNMDIAKKGGHIVWFLDEREIGKAKLSFETAQKNADQFLKKQGFANMVPTSVARYEGLSVFTYIYVQNEVRVYPDIMTVKVAMDNGEVTGFQNEPYLLNHHPRNIPSPSMSLQEARKRVNPSLEVTETHLALVENDDGKEVLTHEFIGRIDRGTYRIYIDASTGEEVKVEKIEGVSI
ncbi:MAG TPA: germination protein YpeB [Paenibacillaceae bacterium]|nr:germination protein YpeB [Paenibacillaceae bacterium]